MQTFTHLIVSLSLNITSIDPSYIIIYLQDTQNIIKNLFTFFFTKYGNEWKEHKFLRQKDFKLNNTGKKKASLTNCLIF